MKPIRKAFDYIKDRSPIYKPLRTNSAHIRLIKIQTSSKIDAVIKCSLSPVSLDDKPKYTALSYVWGNPLTTKEIILNGNPFQVTLNLFSALQYLRNLSASKKTLFWIDAISINQNDVEERNSQVQLMGSIYSNSTEVVAWIGSDPDGQMELAMRTLAIIEKELKYLYDDPLAPEMLRIANNDPIDLNWLSRYPWLLEEDHINRLPNKAWRSVISLLERPYWLRVWILQEMALAPHLRIMSEDSMITFDTLLWFRSFVYHLEKKPVVKPETFPRQLWASIISPATFPTDRILTITFLANLVQEETETNLANLASIFVTVPYQSSDPRDKIFALQGLMGNFVKPDYKKSMVQVYTEYALLHISQYRSTQLLLFSGIGFGVTELPSWVPNWQEMSKSGWNPLPIDNFAADSGLPESSSWSVLQNKPILKVSGCVVDEIDHKYASHFEFIQSQRGEYPTGIPSLQAAIRTLLLDLDLDDQSGHLDRNPMPAMLATLYALRPGDSVSHQLQSTIEDLGIASGNHISTFLSSALPGFESEWNSDLEGIISDLHPRITSRLTTYQSYAPFRAKKGYLGLSPQGIQPNDQLCILGEFPFLALLRKEETGYYYVGPCFVLGLMHGEIKQLMLKEQLTMDEFLLF